MANTKKETYMELGRTDRVPLEKKPKIVALKEEYKGKNVVTRLYVVE
jgi:hypothetical protein